jgi:hypothetical protein
LVLGEAGGLTVVVVLVLDRWDVAAGAVQAAVVEPVDVLQRREFDVVEAAPGAAAADEFGLVQADEGLGGGVVVGVAPLLSTDLMAPAASRRSVLRRPLEPGCTPRSGSSPLTWCIGDGHTA